MTAQLFEVEIEAEEEEEERILNWHQHGIVATTVNGSKGLDYLKLAHLLLDEAHANTEYDDERYAEARMSLPPGLEFCPSELAAQVALIFAGRVLAYDQWADYRGFCLDDKTEGMIQLDLLV
jgi:hypothetical protein